MKTGKVEFNSKYVDGGDQGDVQTADMQGFKYFLVVDGDKMHCSCGRTLVKLTNGAYRCSGGFPTYRPSNGEVMKDKNGGLWLKVLPHQSEEDPTLPHQGQDGK